MEKRIIAGLMAALFFMLANCGSSIKVRYDYDTEENFERFKSFDFMQISYRQNVDREVLKKIKSEITTNLKSKGFSQETENPDLLIAVHPSVKEGINVSDWGYGYAPYSSYWRGYGYWGGGRIDVYTFEEGTLVIDVVDPKEEQMIWRGIAKANLPEYATSERIDQLASDAVAKILENFPPPPKK